MRNCLNDYTTDRRGDVGSLVRTGAIRAVAVVLNKKLLRLPDTQELAATICGLAVERLDRVRIKGWLCLQANWGVFGLGPRPQKYGCAVPVFRLQLMRLSNRAFSEVSQTSTPEYFLQLLSLCTNMGWLRRPILEGYVTSAGAGSESLLRASREAFVTYTEALPIGKLTFLCICLTDIVRENATNERLVVPALDFIGYLFDSGVLPRLRNKEFGWSRLFTAVQQAHFKSSNVHKVEAAVKIYAGLLGVRRVRAKVLEKICSMLLHPFPKVRNAVAEALLIETGDEELMTVNWSRNKDELAPAVQEVRSRLGLGSPKAAAKC